MLSNFSTSLLTLFFFTLAISQYEFDHFEEIYQDDGSNRKNQLEEKGGRQEKRLQHKSVPAPPGIRAPH